MIRTEDCVEALAKAFPQYGEAWKRVSKKKVGKFFVRRFQNRQDQDTYALVTATEERIIKLELELPGEGNFKAEGQAPAANGDLLKRLRENPIKVDLLKKLKDPNPDEDAEEKRWWKEVVKSFSGRVVYDFDDENGFDYDENNAFNFYCGPETKDGAISDQHHMWIEDQLKELFSDFPTANIDGREYSIVDIGSAESLHCVAERIPGVPSEELWKIIEERLRRSGAVPMRRR